LMKDEVYFFQNWGKDQLTKMCTKKISRKKERERENYQAANLINSSR